MKDNISCRSVKTDTSKSCNTITLSQTTPHTSAFKLIRIKLYSPNWWTESIIAFKREVVHRNSVFKKNWNWIITLRGTKLSLKIWDLSLNFILFYTVLRIIFVELVKFQISGHDDYTLFKCLVFWENTPILSSDMLFLTLFDKTNNFVGMELLFLCWRGKNSHFNEPSLSSLTLFVAKI